MLTPEQIQALESHVTTTEAATRVGVSEATIRQWSRRGYISPVNPTEQGQKFYRLVDVLRCDRDRRRQVETKMRRLQSA